MLDASSNVSLDGTQQQRTHQLFHRDDANAATTNSTLDAHLKPAGKTAGSKNMKHL